MQKRDFFAKAQDFIHKLKHLLFDVALLLVFIIWLCEKVWREFR